MFCSKLTSHRTSHLGFPLRCEIALRNQFPENNSTIVYISLAISLILNSQLNRKKYTPLKRDTCTPIHNQISLHDPLFHCPCVRNLTIRLFRIMSIPTTFRLFRVLTSEQIGRRLLVFTLLL